MKTKNLIYTFLLLLTLVSCNEEEVIVPVGTPLTDHIEWEVSIENYAPNMEAYFELTGGKSHIERKAIINGIATGEAYAAPGYKAFIKLDTKGDRKTYYFHLKIWQNDKLVKHAYGLISGGTVETWLILK